METHLMMDFLKVPYENKGIFYSEFFMFITECRDRYVKRIIESGTYQGFTTRMLLASFPGGIITIDRNPVDKALPEAPNLTVLTGESDKLIPGLLEHDEPTGILIDGPKGDKALKLVKECLKYPHVKVIGAHDLPPGNGEFSHSWDKMFRDFIGAELDSHITTSYAQKYPNGPGLAVWVQS